ncbi:MAG: EAL domain-containing protein [Bariatricus sp.]
MVTENRMQGRECDHLTGLCSREAFYWRVSDILEKDPDTQYDMVVADVENFKVVNERFGTKNGDKVLCYLADKYQNLLNGEGICTRMHGDVFAMLIRHGDGSWKDRILWQFGEKETEMMFCNLVIKYGIYEHVDRKIVPAGMCDRAVLALNSIKKLYGKNVAMYDDSLRATLLREQQILDTMEKALKERQFQVYYQAKYDINTENIIGAEALVRWIHPEMGFMSPAEFIPLFEKNGFIAKVDYYVWEEVCKVLRKWKEENRTLIPISVNVSRVDFEIPGLVERITHLVDQYEIDRNYMHLEITESVYTDEPQQIIQMVSRLRENGFKIEMDDFGSGYSSLNMLSELSVDTLKLDMKFIQKNSSDRKNILGFIISLSKWLNLSTIAEGVETKEQIEKLKSFGCDYVQGYYYAKPVPYEEFEQMLDKETEVKKVSEADTEENILETDDGEKQSILIVDDNEMNREILKSMLEEYYDVYEVCNGQEAMDYLLEYPGKIALILLDMVMPVMDGFQFMKKRKERKELAEIPVIITSEAERDSEVMALRLGAERFVGKPYHRELLMLSVKKVIGG